jgi:hypothetical protein
MAGPVCVEVALVDVVVAVPVPDGDVAVPVAEPVLLLDEEGAAAPGMLSGPGVYLVRS